MAIRLQVKVPRGESAQLQRRKTRHDGTRVAFESEFSKEGDPFPASGGYVCVGVVFTGSDQRKAVFKRDVVSYTWMENPLQSTTSDGVARCKSLWNPKEIPSQRLLFNRRAFSLQNDSLVTSHWSIAESVFRNRSLNGISGLCSCVYIFVYIHACIYTCILYMHINMHMSGDKFG